MSVFISASMLEDFVHCPRKVMYRIKKPFPVVETREMILGQLMHSILEKSSESREKAYQHLTDSLETFSITKKEKTNLEFNLDIFFLNFKHLLTDNDLIEQKFKMQIHDDVFLIGKMDRIANGCVFDWKTGLVKSKDMSKNIQAIIYDFAYNKMFQRKANSVFIASLADGKLLPYIRNELYVKEVFYSIIPKLVKTIKSESYDRSGIFTSSCFRCQYKTGCLGEKNVVDSESFIEE